MKAETILVENVVSAGSPRPVNREKYEAVRGPMLDVLPPAEPGLSYTELKAAMLPSCRTPCSPAARPSAGG